MRKFLVNVNGTPYEVMVEEITGAPSAQVAAPATPVASAAPAAAPAGGTKIEAPMPGNIFDIKVSQGASVKKGDVIIVLEAMKMENEIMAPCDGIVSAIQVQKGAAVNAGDILAVIS